MIAGNKIHIAFRFIIIKPISIIDDLIQAIEQIVYT